MIVTKTGVKGVKKKVTLEFIAWVLTDFSSFAAFNSFESCWVLLSNSWITRRESCNETTQHGCQQPRRILTLGAKTKTKREQVSVGDNLTTELPFSSLAFFRLTVESTRQARRASRARDEALSVSRATRSSSRTILVPEAFLYLLKVKHITSVFQKKRA